MYDIRESINYSYGNETYTTCDQTLYSLEKYLDSITSSKNVKKYQVVGHEASTAQFISLKVYGDKSYWWLILMVNGIDNPYHLFPINTIVYYPPISDIGNYKKLLSSYNIKNNNSSNFINGTFVF